VDEPGEICVRGSSLAVGYWNNPERTAKGFVQNPLNPHYPELIYRTGDSGYWNDRGEIMFLGRKDFQIKHLGYRIELGEI
jgi:D-alanine--poly(phosphoribitol) ligase subunit 1